MFDRQSGAPGEPAPGQASRIVCLALAGACAVQILLGPRQLVSSSIPHPWDKVVHFAAYALLTVLAWVGTAGRAPFTTVLAVVAFGALDESHQIGLADRTADIMDFAADVFGASAAGGVLSPHRLRA